MLEVLQRHYVTQLLQRSYLVLGAADAFGSPVNLFRGIAIGVGVFFSAPAHGLVQGACPSAHRGPPSLLGWAAFLICLCACARAWTGPREFAEGLTIGTGTLVRSIGGGLLNSMTQVFGSLGKGMAEASLDPKFQQQRFCT